MIAPCTGVRARLRSRIARSRLRQLRDCGSGIALVEFAVTLPFLLGLGMYGTEVAYMATVRMQVSQLAISVADNASRIGQTDNSVTQPSVNNVDVDSVMFGAMEQGAAIKLAERGRVILSSVEFDGFNDIQWIHWQRCRGLSSPESSYGDQYLRNGTREEHRIAGIGPNRLTAGTGEAIMVAEVYYRHTGIFGDLFVNNQMFRQEAGFLVRPNRNLTPGVSGPVGYTSQSPCPAPPPSP